MSCDLLGAPWVVIKTAGKEQDAQAGSSAACPPPWEACPQSSRCPAAPLGGGQARAPAAVSLVGAPICLCAHPVSRPSTLLELSATEKPAFQQPSQQPPPLPSTALLLCLAISEFLKAGTEPVEAFTVQVYLLGQRLGDSLDVPLSPREAKHSLCSVFPLTRLCSDS